MADVTGPISTLPGATYKSSQGMVCDNHPDRLAVVRIQGETDSFGSEMHDLCQECADQMRESYRQAQEGVCDWCSAESTDLRDFRDMDEGFSGRIYSVCGACRRKSYEAATEELKARGDDGFGYDDEDWQTNEDF